MQNLPFFAEWIFALEYCASFLALCSPMLLVSALPAMQDPLTMEIRANNSGAVTRGICFIYSIHTHKMK